MLPSFLLSNIVANSRGKESVVYVILELRDKEGPPALTEPFGFVGLIPHLAILLTSPPLMSESASDLYLDLTSFPCYLHFLPVAKD